MWLLLNPLTDFSDPALKRPYLLRTPNAHSFNYPLATDEGEALIRQWHVQVDNLMTSGILADWIDDHFDDLLVGATGPTDPALRLRQLVDYLRSRFDSVYENSK